MNILTFSASPKKIWVDNPRRMLNPSYWLLGALMKRLARDMTVFVVPESMDATGRLKMYRGEKIDMMVIMGVAYSPPTIGSSFKRGFVRHRRAFDIGCVVSRVYERDRPLVVLLTVDVRGWYRDATECFGLEPDTVITEQEMRWQQVGYYVARKLSSARMPDKQMRLGFSGHAKKRYSKFRLYMETLPIPAVVDGGAWENHLGHLPNVTLRGTKPFVESAAMLLDSQVGFVLHEPVGEVAGWITAKFFENLGFGCIAFTDKDYDSGGVVLPHDHSLRVTSPADLAANLRKFDYDSWVELQNELVDPAWMDFDAFFYEPFRSRLFADVV